MGGLGNNGIKHGFLWNTIHQAFTIGLNFFALMVLARKLTPEDYGLYAILMIFIGISERVSDSGMGGYLVKKQNATEIYYDTLFVFNMAVSLLLYLILYLLAPTLGSFYDNPNVSTALRVLSVVVVVHAFAVTQNTRLLKEMKFKTLAIIGIISSIVGIIVAVCAAYWGMGYWALILQQIVLVVVSTMLLIVVNKHIPSIHFNYAVFKEQFSFGFYLLVSSFVTTITDNIGNNIVAKVFGLKVTGDYSQANKLQNYPISITRNVVDKTLFPVFSKINNDINHLKIESTKMRNFLYSILFPVFALLIVFCDEIVLAILGEQWIESSSYLCLFLISSFFVTAKTLNRNVLKSLGRTKMIFNIELWIMFALLVGLGISIVFHSIYGVIISYVLSQVLASVLSSWYITKATGWSFVTQLLDLLMYWPFIVIPIAFTSIVSLPFVYKLLFFLVVNIVIIAIYLKTGNTSYSYLFHCIIKNIKSK